MIKNRILLIEDNPDHAEIIINALKDGESGSFGRDVLLIRDGQDAMDYFRKNVLPEDICQVGFDSEGQTYSQVELILLDINLPKVSGIEILKYIRKRSCYSETPVTILSTDSRKGTVEEVFRHGANSFIEKLTSYEELVERLRRVKKLFTESYALT